jgi:hypothetical protein
MVICDNICGEYGRRLQKGFWVMQKKKSRRLRRVKNILSKGTDVEQSSFLEDKKGTTVEAEARAC